jgi:hypothetical protein
MKHPSRTTNSVEISNRGSDAFFIAVPKVFDVPDIQLHL